MSYGPGPLSANELQSPVPTNSWRRKRCIEGEGTGDRDDDFVASLDRRVGNRFSRAID